MAASRTYKTRGIVLRKTKLAEKDLIVTILGEDGSLVRAVAKGARKPGGSMAGRLDLFCIVDALIAKGRSLDVVSDARLAKGERHEPFGLEQASCAAVVAEIVCLVAQEGLEQPRLFDMTKTALDAIGSAEPNGALAAAAAAMLKTMAMAGFRPSFDECVSCGSAIPLEGGPGKVALSFEGGGVVCGSCGRPADALMYAANTLAWAKALLYARFDAVSTMEIDNSVLFEVLHFARQWARIHVGRDVKSLDFVFTGGLF